tara:strand:- start:4376 stop:4864 length:489 start_codon:yes stop_codon:yes gene_type:complete
MISVNVLSEDNIWSKKIKRKNYFFNSICNAFPKKYKFTNKKVNFTLLLSNNRQIRKLNKKFRNKDKPTDILSFPVEKKIRVKKNLYLGDIIISYNFINKPKIKEIRLLKYKVTKIFIHGFLHLLGFDHKKNKDYKKMINEENRIYKSVISKISKFNRIEKNH